MSLPDSARTASRWGPRPGAASHPGSRAGRRRRAAGRWEFGACSICCTF